MGTMKMDTNTIIKKPVFELLSPGFLVFFLISLVVATFVKNALWLRLLTSTLFYGTLAVAFDFTSGFIQVFNMGLSAFVGVGAYTTALMVYHFRVHPLVGLI